MIVQNHGMLVETCRSSMPHAQRPGGDQLAMPRAAKSPYWSGARRVRSGRADTAASAALVASGMAVASGTDTRSTGAAEDVVATSSGAGTASAGACGETSTGAAVVAAGASTGFDDHQKFRESPGTARWSSRSGIDLPRYPLLQHISFRKRVDLTSNDARDNERDCEETPRYRGSLQYKRNEFPNSRGRTL